MELMLQRGRNSISNPFRIYTHGVLMRKYWLLAATPPYSLFGMLKKDLCVDKKMRRIALQSMKKEANECQYHENGSSSIFSR